MVRLAISMHFQQFEDLKFLIFSGEACPGTPQTPCKVSKRRELLCRRDCLDFT